MAQLIPAYENGATTEQRLVNLDHVAHATPITVSGRRLLCLKDAERVPLGYTELHALDHLLVAGRKPRDRNGEQQAEGA